MNTTEQTTAITPGLWHVERHQRFIPHEVGGGSYEGVNTWFLLIVAEDDKTPELRTAIAEVTVSTEATANARAIAAVPHLLAFLQMIASGGLDAADHQTIEAEAREVLAKAIGGAL